MRVKGHSIAAHRRYAEMPTIRHKAPYQGRRSLGRQSTYHGNKVNLVQLGTGRPHASTWRNNTGGRVTRVYVPKHTGKVVLGTTAAAGAGYGGYKAYKHVSNNRNAKTGVRTQSPKSIKTKGRVRRKV